MFHRCSMCVNDTLQFSTILRVETNLGASLNILKKLEIFLKSQVFKQ